MAHHVLILAAGKGSRLNSKTPKQFLEINHLPIIMHSAQAFCSALPAAKIHIALSKDYIHLWPKFCEKYNFDIKHQVYIGGSTRIETVYLGLEKIYKSLDKFNTQDLVSIHDAARPFVNSTFILELISEAKKLGNAIPIMKVNSALRKIYGKNILNNSGKNRNEYIVTQTPQVFTLHNIYHSYKQILFSNTENIFDDAAVYDYFKNKTIVNLVPGREYNIKITTELDYFIAESIYRFLNK